jgi:hypothetical protein
VKLVKIDDTFVNPQHIQAVFLENGAVYVRTTAEGSPQDLIMEAIPPYVREADALWEMAARINEALE